MSLTDSRKFWKLMHDAGETGVHSHNVRQLGVSGNPSQRAKDIASKGFGVCTAREARNGRPGSRYWLAEFAPDYAVPVRPNHAPKSSPTSVERSAVSVPPAEAADLHLFRDFTTPEGLAAGWVEKAA